MEGWSYTQVSGAPAENLVMDSFQSVTEPASLMLKLSDITASTLHTDPRIKFIALIQHRRSIGIRTLLFTVEKNYSFNCLLPLGFVNFAPSAHLAVSNPVHETCTSFLSFLESLEVLGALPHFCFPKMEPRQQLHLKSLPPSSCASETI